MTTSTQRIPIDKSLKKNHEFLQNSLELDINFDIGCRNFKVGNKDIQIYFVNGLTNSQFIIQILKQIGSFEKTLTNKGAFKELFDHLLSHVQVEIVENMDEAVDKLLAGLTIIFGETWDKALMVDIRSYPGRTPEEPDTERVVRGSRDGYTENLIENTSLTRRRIRDARLRMEVMQIGERSKTDICISYIKDIAHPKFVAKIKELIEEIEVDGIPMGEKAVEEFVVRQGYNPFPKIRFTERPDVGAAHLLEGHILIMVDTSPVAMIMPTTFFHHVQHAEEFREAPLIGVYIRWVRILGIIVSVFLLPVWTLLVLQPELMPDHIQFIGPNEKKYSIPIFLQFIFAEVGIDLMRMAAIHTPSPLATALGLVAAILIGQIAIDVGLFLPEVILYLSLAAIGMFATPSYELGTALKLVRLLLLVLVFVFKVPGLVIGTTLIIIWLVKMESIETPYFWPLIPFNLNGFMNTIFRFSSTMTRTRPSIVKPRNKIKQS